jgi:hypothetical protein
VLRLRRTACCSRFTDFWAMAHGSKGVVSPIT